jgi:hypothetical protein
VPHIIMPPQHIIIGMPACIMFIMALQQAVNISFDMPSGQVISQDMPFAVILQDIIAIIIGMGIIPPMGMLPIIIGIIAFIIGIIPPIMGICIGAIIALLFICCKFLRRYALPGKSVSVCGRR